MKTVLKKIVKVAIPGSLIEKSRLSAQKKSKAKPESLKMKMIKAMI